MISSNPEKVFDEILFRISWVHPHAPTINFFISPLEENDRAKRLSNGADGLWSVVLRPRSLKKLFSPLIKPPFSLTP